MQLNQKIVSLCWVASPSTYETIFN